MSTTREGSREFRGYGHRRVHYKQDPKNVGTLAVGRVGVARMAAVVAQLTRGPRCVIGGAHRPAIVYATPKGVCHYVGMWATPPL